MIPDKERHLYMATTKVNVSKISDFPKVTTLAGTEQILIEKNGEGGHINLSEMPVSKPVEDRISEEATDLNKRIDNIVASSGDDISEIVDARQGSDGTNYASLRARLDAENNQLKGDLAVVSDLILNEIQPTPIVGKSFYNENGYWYLTNYGTNTYYRYELKKGLKYTILGSDFRFAFSDEDGSKATFKVYGYTESKSISMISEYKYLYSNKLITVALSEIDAIDEALEKINKSAYRKIEGKEIRGFNVNPPGLGFYTSNGAVKVFEIKKNYTYYLNMNKSICYGNLNVVGVNEKYIGCVLSNKFTNIDGYKYMFVDSVRENGEDLNLIVECIKTDAFDEIEDKVNDEEYLKYKVVHSKHPSDPISGFGYVSNLDSIKKGDILTVESSIDIREILIRVGDYTGTTIYHGSYPSYKFDSDYDCISVLIKKVDLSSWNQNECLSTDVIVKRKSLSRYAIEPNVIYIASNDATYAEKSIADYICDGINDEVEFRKALQLAERGDVEVHLSSGDFYFDNFDSNNGICGVSYAKHITIKGVGRRGSKVTVIHVTDTALESLGDNEGFVFGANHYLYSLTYDLFDFKVYLEDNQHKVTIIDCSRNASGIIERVSLSAVPIAVSNTNDTPLPVEGCNGIRTWCGDDSGTHNMIKNCFCTGFYEGFQLGAEHVVLEQCGGRFNYYTYTFGNYEYHVGTCSHPITLINCCDEHSACLPKFVENGYYNEENVRALQGVDMISFNMELSVPPLFNHSDLVTPCHEKNPSTWCGNINYLAYGKSNINGGQQSSATAGNIVSVKFFDNESGKNFTVKNDTHKLGGTTEERLTYVPHYMQEYYDTDLNKKLIYNGVNWVDYNGNVIS